MTHPHQLHAQAAAASLRVALVSLGHRAHAERYGWASAGDGLRSPSWGSGGRGQGGHGDPVGIAIAGTVRTAGDRRARWTLETLTWLASALQLPDEAPLDAIECNLPRLAPSTAWQLTLWLRELDDRCRDTAGLGAPVGRIAEACPACNHTRWRIPGDFVVCRNEICLCAGIDCACDMPVAAAGAQHIWAPQFPTKPERNEDGIDALRYAIAGTAAIIRARRTLKGE